MMTKKHLKVLKIMHDWTRQPECIDRLGLTLLHRLWFVLLSQFIFSVTSSFPQCSSLFIKEGTIFAFSSGKRSVTGWGREPFSDGRRRTAKHLEMHQKSWLCSWRPGTASLSCSIALTKKDAPSENDILMTGDHPITTPPWQDITANLPLLSLLSVSLTLWRFCRLQHNNCIIPANENVMFHCWLPQPLKSILI